MIGTPITRAILDGEVTNLKSMVEKSMQTWHPTMYGAEDETEKFKQEIEDCEKQIDKLNRKRKSTWEKEIKVFYQKQKEERQTLLNKTLSEVDKIRIVLKKVKKWKTPSPDYKDFKEFMVNHLETEIELMEVRIDGYKSGIAYFDTQITNPNIEQAKAMRLNYLHGKIVQLDFCISDNKKKFVNKKNWVETLMKSFEK